MKLGRREFLYTAAATGFSSTAVGLGAETQPSAVPDTKEAAVPMKPKHDAVLKLSCQEGPAPGDTLAEKLDKLEAWGFDGVELYGRDLPTRLPDVQKALEGRSIKVSAICAGFEGWLIAEERETRDLAMKTIKERLDAAGALNAEGVIIVPAFNNQPSLPHRESRVLLTGFDRWDRRQEHENPPLLQQLSEYAVQVGTRLLLEPLNREECYFMRTLAAAASMCKDVNNPGLAMMGDFWHMTWEETSDMGAFITGGNYLHHVHIASRRRRKMPGEDGPADDYKNGFKGLKAIGYQDYISFECGSVGDPNETIPAAVKLIREQWAAA